VTRPCRTSSRLAPYVPEALANYHCRFCIEPDFTLTLASTHMPACAAAFPLSFSRMGPVLSHVSTGSFQLEQHASCAGKAVCSSSYMRSAVSVQRSSVSVQRSAFSVQRSAFSVQRSALSGQRSALSGQRSAFSGQRSAFSFQRSAVSVQRSAFSVQRSAFTVKR
jgi:hypothetical protein